MRRIDTGYLIPDAGYRILDIRHWIPGILDARYFILSTIQQLAPSIQFFSEDYNEL
jgi:hypothetical protein